MWLRSGTKWFFYQRITFLDESNPTPTNPQNEKDARRRMSDDNPTDSSSIFPITSGRGIAEEELVGRSSLNA